ncbi:MAG: hypothetical protein H3C35_11520 [Bacteroidetes bacterium]|nr:hypothetical protein [Bacteroidota bacterium]
MNWLDEIQTELKRSLPNENPGRTRTIARRAAGIALQHFYHEDNTPYLTLLQSAAEDRRFPVEVQEAAKRLSERISGDFKSASVHPIGDAKIIIEFVKKI